jgi:hypothetical protein
MKSDGTRKKPPHPLAQLLPGSQLAFYFLPLFFLSSLSSGIIVIKPFGVRVFAVRAECNGSVPGAH